MQGTSTWLAPLCLSPAEWLLMCCAASVWPEAGLGSWYSNGVVSNGGIGPVFGETYNLFGLLSAELKGNFSEQKFG